MPCTVAGYVDVAHLAWDIVEVRDDDILVVGEVVLVDVDGVVW